MTTLKLEIDPAISHVIVTDEELILDLADGRSLTVPLTWYPRLKSAAREERQNCQIIGSGHAIEWPDLDEHIGIEGLLAGRPSGEGHRSFKRWLTIRKSLVS